MRVEIESDGDYSKAEIVDNTNFYGIPLPRVEGDLSYRYA